MIEGLLEDRCVTCRHWKGDRENILKQLKEAHDQDLFLSYRHTWAGSGDCEEIGYVCSMAEPEGVFGCILHESIPLDNEVWRLYAEMAVKKIAQVWKPDDSSTV